MSSFRKEEEKNNNKFSNKSNENSDKKYRMREMRN